MGKTSKWFRAFLALGGIKRDSSSLPSSSKKSLPPPRASVSDEKTVSTVSSRRLCRAVGDDGEIEIGIVREMVAAVKIQSAFRGYLARRALKALKGVVRLQALVRGHITRKKKAEEMRCMQALLRLQSRARASRLHMSEIPHLNSKSPLSQQSGPATPEKHERSIRSKSTRPDRTSPLKRNSSVPHNRNSIDWDKTQLRRDLLDRRIDEHAWDYYCRETQMKYGLMADNNSGTVKQEIVSQPYKHHVTFDRLSFQDSPSKDSTTAHLSNSSLSSGEVQSRYDTFCTSENSPYMHSATSIASSSKRGAFTTTPSDCSRSIHSMCTDHPNYMSNTKSSSAKARSQSAPKQRSEFLKSSSARRHGSHGSADMRRNMLRASALESSFANKVYPGSGRLDRFGVSGQHEFSDAYGNRY